MPKVQYSTVGKKCSRCRHDRQKVPVDSLACLLTASNLYLRSVSQNEELGRGNGVTAVNASIMCVRQTELRQRRRRLCMTVLRLDVVRTRHGSLEKVTAIGKSKSSMFDICDLKIT